MSDLPKTVTIKEVGPREGFQFEKGGISLADKIALVDALSGTGVGTIEFTSFVSPKWVPQMADAEQMIDGITRAPGVAYEAIWLNQAGLDRAAQFRDRLHLRPMFGVAGTGFRCGCHCCSSGGPSEPARVVMRAREPRGGRHRRGKGPDGS